jgi:tetratricopeptide (TPR) repeat protein
VPGDEVGEDELLEAMAEADRDGRLLQLMRSPERLRELIQHDALPLDFDLVLELSGGLAARGDRQTAEYVAMAAVAAEDRKVGAAGDLAIAWLQVTGGKARKAQSLVEGLAGWSDPDVLAEATYLRGVILQERGKHTRAAEEYRRAMGVPRRKTAGMSALALGEILAEAGDLEGTVEALAFAYDCGDPSVEAEAALKLALLRDQVGDVDGAIPFYEEAVESEEPAVAPQAAFHLGEILRDAGDLAGARQALETAYATDDPEFAPKAAVNLGIMYMEEERVSEAYQCFESAAASPDSAVASLGHCYLGVVLGNAQPSLAEQHLRTAVRTGNEQVQEMASRALAMLRPQ